MHRSLSIIIPAFRAASVLEQSLPLLRGYLDERGLDAEVIVVDDGSDDAGATEAVVIASGFRYASLDRNSGKGAAVRHGMLQASGAVCLFTDADLPFGLSSIEHFYMTLRHGDFDGAIGDRSLDDSRYFSAVPWRRKIASRLFAWFVGQEVCSRFPDTQCGLKGFTRPVARMLFSELATSGFAFDVELLYGFIDHNLRIQRLPVQLRNQGQSSISLARHGRQMAQEILELRRARRLRQVAGIRPASLSQDIATKNS